MLKRMIFYISFTTGLIFFVVLVITSSFKHSVNKAPYDVENLIMALFPEGWGFFTRSPREQNVKFYKLTENGLYELPLRSADARNLMGVSRMGRKILMEGSIMMGQVPDSLWSYQTGAIRVPTSSYNIPQTQNLHYLKEGEYLICLSDPVPLHWSKMVDRRSIRKKIVRVSCNKETNDDKVVTKLF